MNDDVRKKIDTFFKNYKLQKYRKGEILIRADDNPSGIFYLIKGFVKEYAISKKGEELIVNTFKPFAFFPMSWAINETPNTYFFEAINEVEIYRAPQKESVNFIKENPNVMFDLLSRVYRGTDGILARMTYMMASSARSRLIIELVIQAKRFGKKNGSKITLELSEKNLAAQTGMSRETISREFKNLKDSGIVTIDNTTLIINDLAILEIETNQEI